MVHGKDGPIQKYLSPTSRILTDQATPTFCSDKFPVKFRISKKLSICQFGPGDGLKACVSTDSLDPRDGLDKYILATLSKEESTGPKYEMKNQLSKLLVSFITSVNFHQSLSKTVAYNSFVCKDSLLCRDAFFLNAQSRQELNRQNLNFMGKLLSNWLYQALSLVSNLWVLYSLFIGLISFVLRFKAVISRRKYGGILQLIFTFFVEFEAALNPLSLSKAKLKQQQRKTTLEIDDLKNRLFLLETRYHSLSSNIHGNIDQVENEEEALNQPVEATFHFRDSGDFKHQHEGMKERIKKFVTFKTNEEDDQQGRKNCQDPDFPPPPDWSTTSSGYEKASLLSVKAQINREASNPLDYLEPVASSRPRLKVSRLPPPASSQPSGTQGPPPPPPLPSSGTGSPSRKAKKAPPPPPPTTP